MNNDLISRSALIDALPIVTKDRKVSLFGVVFDFVDIICNAPAVDAVEVVHGEWEDYHFVKVDCPKSGFPTVKCSVCEIVFCDLINNHHFMYHFCPNCGADMRERKGDDERT